MASGKTQLPSEYDVSNYFIDLYREDVRYDHDKGTWYIWDEKIWQQDKTKKVMAMIIKICSGNGFRTWQKISAVEKLVRCSQIFSAQADLWDNDPWLLGTPDGTIDLREGKIRKADQGDYITKSIAVVPAPEGTKPKLWLKFLDQVMLGDKQLTRYLQMAIGYTMTGLTTENLLFFNWGTGGNGKSTFFNIILRLMADYAVTAAENVFTDDGRNRHSTDLAMLDGARFVVCSENTSGQTWNDERIKRATGGEKITARFMGQNNFSFKPAFKLWFMGNARPSFRHVDEGMKRRFQLIAWMFSLKEAERDLNLEEKLMQELPAIARWAIDGCLMWQSKLSLESPDKIREETEAYFEDEDVLGSFIREKCDIEPRGGVPNYRTQSKTLYSQYVQWCKDNGEDCGSHKYFTGLMLSAGFEKRRTAAFSEFLLIRIKPRMAGYNADPWLTPSTHTQAD